MTRSRRAALALPTVLAALLLAGCGGGDDGGDGGDREDLGFEVESTPDAGESVGTDLVSFELPEGWAVLDQDEVGEEVGTEDNPVVTDLAERMGIPPTDLAQQMQGIELFAAAPGGAVDGFVTNVNVIEQPLPPGGVPEGDDLRPQLEAFADEVGTLDPIDTDDAEGVRATYSLTTGGASVNGVQFYIEAGDELSIITVTATRAEDAADVADAIEDSLVPD